MTSGGGPGRFHALETKLIISVMLAGVAVAGSNYVRPPQTLTGETVRGGGMDEYVTATLGQTASR